jgi:hypothetical protein
MRLTWIILGVMLIAGAAMYYVSTIKRGPGIYDSIAIEHTADSLTKRIKIYLANDPAEVYYLDSVWLQQDSTPLKKVLESSKLSFINRRYSSVTLFLVYNDHFFYDLEVDKPDTTASYEISFNVRSQHDTLYVKGAVDNRDGDVLGFEGPMIPLYKQFVLTYNNKLPPPPPDSTATDGDSTQPAGLLPNKTITILRN